MQILLPEALFHNRFYKVHELEVSNALRLALAILGTVALSAAGGWPYPLALSITVVRICEATAIVSLFGALFYRFVYLRNGVYLDSQTLGQVSLAVANHIKIEGPGVLGRVGKTLAQLSSLACLSLIRGTLNVETIPYLANLQIDELYLGYNPLIEVEFKKFVETLALVQNLQELDLRNNGLSDNEAKILAEAIPNMKKLRFLVLIEPEISKIGQDALVAACRKNDTEIRFG